VSNFYGAGLVNTQNPAWWQPPTEIVEPQPQIFASVHTTSTTAPITWWILPALVASVAM
jgi:hypothetical protein